MTCTCTSSRRKRGSRRRQNVRTRFTSTHVEAENAHDMAGTFATLHEDYLFEDLARAQQGAFDASRSCMTCYLRALRPRMMGIASLRSQ
jgi:hypothetical protein